MLRHGVSHTGVRIDWKANGEEFPTNYRNINQFKCHPIHYAVTYGTKDCVRALVDAGADINQTDRCGMTPIFYLMGFKRPDAADMAQFIIENGALVNLPIVPNSVWPSPLHRCMDDESLPVVKLLIQYGARFSPDDFGAGLESPAQVARRNGAHKVAEFLEQKVLSMQNQNKN